VQSANAIQSTDPEKIAQYMHSGHVFDTVIGKISYDERGDMLQANYVMYVWKLTASGGLDYAGNELTD
jgi:branched-chain amino acid transport system substrate-binding protein